LLPAIAVPKIPRPTFFVVVVAGGPIVEGLDDSPMSCVVGTTDGLGRRLLLVEGPAVVGGFATCSLVSIEKV